jgi:hypothetical protein
MHAARKASLRAMTDPIGTMRILWRKRGGEGFTSFGRSLVTLAAGLLLPVGCASIENTLAQDLAFDRWEKCRNQAGGIKLQRITADGQVLVIYTADHRLQFNLWQACMKQAAAKQGQRGTTSVPAPMVAAAQDQSLASLPGALGPTWRVGDEWGYRYEEPIGSGTFVWNVVRTESLNNVQHFVIRTGTREIFYRLSDLAFTRETVDGQTVREATPSDWRFVAFPLHVGKSWEMKYLEMRPVDRQTQDIQRKCTVEAEERMTVAAGTFSTFRIICHNSRNNAWVMTVWYSPEVRQIVREESALATGRRIRELIAFRLR